MFARECHVRINDNHFVAIACEKGCRGDIHRAIWIRIADALNRGAVIAERGKTRHRERQRPRRAAQSHAIVNDGNEQSRTH